MAEMRFGVTFLAIAHVVSVSHCLDSGQVLRVPVHHEYR